MPASDYHAISDVLHAVHQANPKSLLDVGVGFGKWGVLCREVLEVYDERLQRASWNRKIEGIEIFEPYRNALWEFAYDRVHVGNALTILDDLPQFDLALCCDVIEHFTKSEGVCLIGKLLKVASMVVITSPCGVAPQGASFENVHEAHLSHWGSADFLSFPHRFRRIGFTFIALLARDEQQFTRVNTWNPVDAMSWRALARQLGARFLGRARRSVRL